MVLRQFCEGRQTRIVGCSRPPGVCKFLKRLAHLLAHHLLWQFPLDDAKYRASRTSENSLRSHFFVVGREIRRQEFSPPHLAFAFYVFRHSLVTKLVWYTRLVALIESGVPIAFGSWMPPVPSNPPRALHGKPTQPLIG